MVVAPLLNCRQWVVDAYLADALTLMASSQFSVLSKFRWTRADNWELV
jgi:hypothetical protein